MLKACFEFIFVGDGKIPDCQIYGDLACLRPSIVTEISLAYLPGRGRFILKGMYWSIHTIMDF